MTHAVSIGVPLTGTRRSHVGVKRVSTLQIGVVGATRHDGRTVFQHKNPANVCRLEFTFILGQVRDAI